MKKMKLDRYHIPLKKIKSKWINNLIIKSEAIKLEENIRKKLLDIGHGSEFLDLTLKAKAIEAKINKWDYIQLKKPLHN